MSLLSWLVGSSPTSDRDYQCTCGAPMELMTDVPYNEYSVQTWRCTDDECLRRGQAYLFEEDGDSYGEGVLAGQVDP